MTSVPLRTQPDSASISVTNWEEIADFLKSKDESGDSHDDVVLFDGFTSELLALYPSLSSKGKNSGKIKSSYKILFSKNDYHQ